MAQAGNASKRPRTDGGDVEQRTPHPDLWYDDGSVVLASKSHLFRVHRSMLSKTSSVFADMFSMPAPPTMDESEMYEGLPLVHLAGDDDEDVVHFLKRIYEHSYYQGLRKTELSTVIALLRMSTKYAVDSIRKQTIEHLATAYPATLEEFEKLSYGTSPGPYLSFKFGPRVSPIHRHLEVIRVARETSAEVLLPAAFYFAASHPLKDRIAHFVSNGIISLDNLQTILVGREALQIATQATVLTFIDELAPEECTSNEECRMAKQCASAREDVRLAFVRDPCTLDLACDLRHMIMPPEYPQMCKHCSAAFTESIQAGHQKVWNNLPSFFGLRPWEELKRA